MQIAMTQEVMNAFISVADFARGIAHIEEGGKPALNVTLDTGFLSELRAAVAGLDKVIGNNLSG